MIHIQIEDPFEGLIVPDELVKAALAVLQHQSHDLAVELSVVIDSDEKLRQLNRDFLGIDTPTDVLSFPSEEFDPDEQADYIGDIIISYPRALAQAKAAGHPVGNEIKLLVVHGVLHLLGHDHAESVEKSRMWQAQSEILNSLGVTVLNLPE
jgi:probable rRNA maturation factor